MATAGNGKGSDIDKTGGDIDKKEPKIESLAFMFWMSMLGTGFLILTMAKLLPSFKEHTTSLIEDSFLFLLTGVSLFVLAVVFKLFIFSKLAVRSNSWQGALHIHTGWLQVPHFLLPPLIPLL
jgi:hypothetical protein